MKVALAQLNFVVGDLDGNVERMRRALSDARAAGADLAVFSELALSGYPPRDLLSRDAFVDAQLARLDELARESTTTPFVVGFTDRNRDSRGKRLFNAAALCDGGVVQDVVHKQLLPTYDVFDEDRYFEPTKSPRCMTFRGTRLGVSICEDAWNLDEMWERRLYHADPIAALASDGAELLINISASPFTLDKERLRRDLLQRHAKAHGLPLVAVNQVGANDELVFDGYSVVVAPDGELRRRLAGFEEDFAVVDVLDGDARVDVDIHDPPPTQRAYRALVLGVRDYLHKSGFRRAIIGLSGGIDSALVAAIAAEALGSENVWAVGMPSRHSSEGSVVDARQLAENLGIRFDVVPIEPVFSSFLDQLEPLFEGTEPGLAEENLQARARGTILMALSNKFGGLVLTTGNKSETAVGYATLYGDMCGALAVIGDVPKMLVYEICRWLNRDREIIPHAILTKPPSAELRPDQVDADSLPPYEILDAILHAYVVEGATRDELLAAGFEGDVVDHVVRLLHRAEYKRYQAAPIIKVTDVAFGSGWRYPLVGNFDHSYK